MKPIFLDHHSTTPMDPRVLESMLPYFTEDFGNPASRTHAYGWKAAEAVERSRQQIASLLQAAPRDILFTSGATESDNLAIKGAAGYYRDQGDHMITCRTEHPAVLDSCRALEKDGMRVTYLPVDVKGLLDPSDVRRAITRQTVLISVMFANHEIGTLHDVATIGKIAKEQGVLLHCDATQAVGKEPIDVEALGVDLLSLSAHKIYGPKGIGALYVRRRNPRVRLTPLIDGGGHERNFRSGTLNVPGIIGLATACRLAQEEMGAESQRLRRLRDRLHRRLLDELEEIRLNGHPRRRLSGNLNLSFAGLEGNDLLKILRHKVALSLGSACTSAIPVPSHILKAIGVPSDLVLSTVRFGLGRFNTEAEIDQVAEEVIQAVRRLRAKSASCL